MVFHNLSNYVAVAQWIKFSAGELNDPGSIPGQGEFFTLKFLFKEEKNQMVNNKNNNNSSNSLVFGLWLQTKKESLYLV